MLLAAEWTRGDQLGVAGLVISAIGLIATAIGFVVAIVQLRRTAQATEATRDTLVKSSSAQLLFLLPQFRLIETELDLAIANESRELVPRILASYAYLANEVAAMIEIYGLAEGEAVAVLRTSAKSAAEAKNQLYTTSKGKLAEVTREFRQSLFDVGVQLSQLSSTQKQKLEGRAAVT